MAWLGVIATGICGVSFFVASEWAGGLKEGKLRSKAAFIASVVSLCGCIAGLVCFPPDDGIPRLATVLISGVCSLACFWFMKSHIDHFRGQAGIVSGILGLALLAVGTSVFLQQMPEHPVSMHELFHTVEVGSFDRTP